MSRVWVYQVRDREQKTGKRTSFQIGGHRRSCVAEMESTLRVWIEAEPDLALSELSERLAEQGVLIKPGALWHQLNNWNLTFKKTLRASEQEREDLQQMQREWVEALPRIDSEKRVFIDETWTSTGMTRRCGRSPKGQRCIASAPHGHWETTTFVGALRRRRLTTPMVTDGPMDGEMFLAYIRQFLYPTLQSGDMVILDNLSSHKCQALSHPCNGCNPALLLLSRLQTP